MSDTMTLFPAVWPGHCRDCGDEFDRLDLIGYRDGVGPICGDCTLADTPPRREPPVCTGCNLAHAGGCP